MLYTQKRHVGYDPLNNVGRPTATAGQSVTPVVGSKGSWTTALFGGALASAVYGIGITIHANSTTITSRNTVLDLGIDPAGGTAYSVLIPDLLCGGAAVLTTSGLGITYFFPLAIPVGSTVSLRAQGSVTTAFLVLVTVYQDKADPAEQRYGNFVESRGITAPAGTAVTFGTTSDGAWTSLGAASRDLWWWQIGVQIPTSDTSWNAQALALDLAVGDATNKKVIIEDAMFFSTAAETLQNGGNGEECFVPAGSTLYVRGQGGGTLDTYQIAVWGVGG